ncbi:Hypothetical protein ETEE_1607 [Edwardsiella anguillarum ET080813]|uniref:Uncharacterized protein n=1 Tax=Edwardsiella anguillarum ET080813 TaxID=667120 RepID=A0A076LJE9_9GAMM|nr:Hypothetical protein ETEE_1607 [Edwardsiella anguillarum ET080813]
MFIGMYDKSFNPGRSRPLAPVLREVFRSKSYKNRTLFYFY